MTEVDPSKEIVVLWWHVVQLLVLDSLQDQQALVELQDVEEMVGVSLQMK